jgi:hypothetical protein
MKIYNNKKVIHLITSFNQLHGYHAIRSTYYTTLQATSCQFVFGRDMIHNIEFRANWNQIQKEKTGHYQQVQSKTKQELLLNSL